MARDIRNERTEEAIVDGLLQLLTEKPLERISVSEVARTAQVSRSTFYAHFSGIDEVFSRTVLEFTKRTRRLDVQLRCSSCNEPGPGIPFCMQVRESRSFRALVEEPRFLSTYLEIVRADGTNPIATELEKENADPAIIDALIRFQMSGGYSVAINTHSDVNWHKIQSALDAFIRGGLNALRTHMQQP